MFKFAPCQTSKLRDPFTFPSRRDNCETEQFDDFAATFNGEVTNVDLVAGHFGNSRENQYKFPHTNKPFVFLKPFRLEDFVLAGEGEYSLIHEPNSAVLTLDDLALHVSLTGESATLNEATLTVPLDLDVSFTGYNVPIGQLSVSLDTDVTFTGQLDLIASLNIALDSDVQFVGLLENVGQFDTTFDSDFNFIGDITAQEGSFSFEMDAPIFALHGLTYIWGNLALVRASGCSTTNNAKQLRGESCVAVANAPSVFVAKCAGVEIATSVYRTRCVYFDTAVPLYNQKCVSVAIAKVLSTYKCANTQNAEAVHLNKCTSHDTAIPKYSVVCFNRQNAEIVAKAKCAFVEDAARSQIQTSYKGYVFNSQDYVKYTQTPLLFTANGGAPLNTPFTFTGLITDFEIHKGTGLGSLPVSVCIGRESATQVDKQVCANNQTARYPNQGICEVIPYVPPEKPPIVIDNTRTTFTIPNQEVYVMDANLTAFILGTNVKIPLTSVSLSYSPSTFAWQMNASMEGGSAVDLLKPAANGEPVVLDINVNGIHWTISVEEITRQRSFVHKPIGIIGSGLTSRLGSPYHIPTSFVFDEVKTVQQMVDTLLPADWTLDWQMPDGSIPANTFSITDSTPVEAIGAIVTQCQGILVPSLTSKILKVVPRTPVLPYNQTTTAPDFVFSEDIIESVVEVSETESDINGVFIHGTEPSGVIGKVLKYGTNGDSLLPTVNNQFAVSSELVKHLGEQILSDHINRPKLKEVTLPLDSVQFPLMNSGSFVKITISPSDTDIPDGTHAVFDTVYGCVNSINISANETKVTQTISLGDHDLSMLSAFKSLIPKSHVVVGSVIANVGLSSKVQLIGGGVITAKGISAVGSLVYVKDLRIDGVLPALTQIADTTIG